MEITLRSDVSSVIEVVTEIEALGRRKGTPSHVLKTLEAVVENPRAMVEIETVYENDDTVTVLYGPGPELLSALAAMRAQP